MPYKDDDDEDGTPVVRERLFTCPSCKASFKLKVSAFRGQKTVKCVNADCGKEISVEVKSDSMSQLDRAMNDLDKTLGKLGDFKIDI